ncbi:hypothetical protein [Pseudomonas koreensis]|uniref:hypothetical protein n=1 Tax=Pseudomonas koreensis TaxID=198620 RepID=UPI0014744783|nr:hypothetical protein [Pseudomonas koreensis]NNA56892.1 hypothetical protein [Pseudomonas koreensis]
MAITWIQDTLENTGILHAGQMTDHANNRDTDGSFIFNLLKNKENNLFEKLARTLQ